MKLKKINSDKVISLNVSNYRINWDRKVSGPQKKVKDFLRKYWSTHSVLEELPIPGSKLRVDIINVTDMVAIEVSPRQHFSYNAFLHKGHQTVFLKNVKSDCNKKQWCIDNGFTYIEITDDDLDKLSEELFKEKFGVIL